MPTDFSALLDTLLVLAGLVLVATGLVMFIRSKTSTQASSVEAFGIKLNVTHPSLILVLAGVGLMLAPRLLPEPAGKAGQAEPAVDVAAPPRAAATAPPTSSEPAPPPARPSMPTPAATVAPPATPATKPAVVSPLAAPSSSVAQATRPTAPAKPQPVAPAVPKKPTPKIASVRPAPAAAVTAEEPAPASPPATSKPARPTLAYAALGLPINRSFWDNETRASYTRRMHASLQQAGREVLRMDARGLELGQPAFDAWWNESGQHPRSRELCAAAQGPLALLSARVETPTTLSSVESAYWPELKLRLFVCANQRIYRQQKTLSPQNDDAWPFATELNSEIERFLRSYRGDLTSD